jgi:glutamyl-tRNA reductase
VAFVEDGKALDGDWLIVADADAYALLVEIVSGLRSPLLGETEVQAQFKAFLASLDLPGDAAILRLGQRVLADAKRIRPRARTGRSSLLKSHRGVGSSSSEPARSLTRSSRRSEIDITSTNGAVESDPDRDGSST